MAKYKLIKLLPKKRYYEVYINAVSNDADYFSTTTEYTQEEFDDIVDELINLRDNYSGWHKLDDYPNIKYLEIPCSEWGLCHTLDSLVVRMYDTDGCIYTVDF